MKKINVIQFPVSPNPYQHLLKEHLERYAVSVRFLSDKDVLNLSFFRLSSETDVVHIHWLDPFFIHKSKRKALARSMGLIVRLLYLRLRGIGIVWTVHNLSNHENKNPILDHLCSWFASRLSNKIIVHCQDSKKETVKELNLRSGKKVSVVFHGSYVPFYNELTNAENDPKPILGIPCDKITFLFFGMLRPYKGIIDLIDSFKLLDNRQCQLVIAGRIFDKSFGNLMIEHIDGHPDIHLVPKHIPDERVPSLMRAAHVVIFPFQKIITSGSVILALTFSKPCIAPKLGCIPEYLDSNGSFLYDPEKPNGLLEALKDAVVRKNDLVSMGAHNRLLAENLSWDEIGVETKKVYECSMN